MARIIGIDIYQYSDINWKALADSPVALVVIKADARAVEHAKHAVEIGRKVAMYHWSDPTRAINEQADATKRVMDLVSTVADVEFIALDWEQWWLDWSAWWRMVTQKVPYTGAKISVSQSRDLIERMLSVDFGVRKIVYTAKWYIDAYGGGYLPDAPLWTARYVTNALRKITWDDVMEIASGVQPQYPRTVGVQFADKYIPPGFTRPVDLNWFDADFCNVEHEPPRKNESMAFDVSVIAPLGLRIRQGPSTSTKILGVLKYGTKAKVYNWSDGWYKLAQTEGWISKAWTKRD